MNGDDPMIQTALRQKTNDSNEEDFGFSSELEKEFSISLKESKQAIKGIGSGLAFSLAFWLAAIWIAWAIWK